MNVKEPILYLHQIDESILLISQYTTGITEEFFCDDRKTIDMELRCGYHYGIRTANILSFGLNRAEQKKTPIESLRAIEAAFCAKTAVYRA